MIRVKNQQMQLIAILENAFNISYEKRLNELWLARFSLPSDDTKIEHCEPFNFVEITDNMTGEYIGLFRIEPSRTMRSESAGVVEFELYHVFSTLLDDVLFGYHQTTNWTTTQNIDYILSQQTTKHWCRGNVAFTRYFSYKYENENGLLGPMYAIPKPFDEGYQWTYDTSSYPWTLGLKELSSSITCEIRYAKNMREIERQVETIGVVNRIYALGSGEGINQLRIDEVNGGVPYLEDAASIAKYGRKAYVWVDRRFEDAQSLKGNAANLLNEWKQPKVVYKVKAADLSVLTGESVDKFVEGALVRVVDPDFGVIVQRIHMVRKPDITGAPGEIELEIGSMSEDIATTIADAERKIQVNEAYTQGSTNIDSHNYNDNCDSSHPAIIRFYLPNDLVKVNSMSLSYETDSFRAYSAATKGGGSTTKTTTSGGGTTATSSSGGGTTATSSSGGGVSTSTSSGGGTTQSSAAGGDHRHLMFSATGFQTASNPNSSVILRAASGNTIAVDSDTAAGVSYYTEGSSGNHSHSVSIPSHTHDFNVPNHSHSVSIPNHTHSVTIPNHSHDVILPDHTHDIQHGIYELSTKPSAVTVKIDGTTIPGSAINGNDIDIVPYLAKDSGGKIRRGSWHEVTLTPNGLGRINANIISRLFISSHIGGNY